MLLMCVCYLLNSIFQAIVWRTSSATDQQWFRLFIYNMILICIQALVTIANMCRLFISSPDSTEVCDSSMTVVAMVLNVIFGIVLVVTVVMLIRIRFELQKNMSKYFHYKPEPEIAVKYA